MFEPILTWSDYIIAKLYVETRANNCLLDMTAAIG